MRPACHCCFSQKVDPTIDREDLRAALYKLRMCRDQVPPPQLALLLTGRPQIRHVKENGITHGYPAVKAEGDGRAEVRPAPVDVRLQPRNERVCSPYRSCPRHGVHLSDRTVSPGWPGKRFQPALTEEEEQEEQEEQEEEDSVTGRRRRTEEETTRSCLVREGFSCCDISEDLLPLYDCTVTVV
eukprot:765140-Hanusia_phi.AAC.1